MEISVGTMSADEWPSVQAVYAEGLATGIASFNSDVPEWDEWDEDHLEIGRITAKSGDEVVGWAALSSVGST